MTYTELAISPAAFDEIVRAMKAAGVHDHDAEFAGLALDGIAIRRGAIECRHPPCPMGGKCEELFGRCGLASASGAELGAEASAGFLRPGIEYAINVLRGHGFAISALALEERALPGIGAESNPLTPFHPDAPISQPYKRATQCEKPLADDHGHTSCEYRRALENIAVYDPDGPYCAGWKAAARQMQEWACAALDVAKGSDVPAFDAIAQRLADTLPAAGDLAHSWESVALRSMARANPAPSAEPPPGWIMRKALLRSSTVAHEPRPSEPGGPDYFAARAPQHWPTMELLKNASAAESEGHSYTAAAFRAFAQLLADEAAYRATAPLCEKHQPRGGTRAVCLVCILDSMSSALSRIDYLCGEPNEMSVSDYDMQQDEEAVVKRVEERLKRNSWGGS